MRVTNERAQSAIKAHHITGNMTNIVKDYATDLLEARELIREMRMFINSIQLDGCMAEIKRDEILDRTKDYAE